MSGPHRTAPAVGVLGDKGIHLRGGPADQPFVTFNLFTMSCPVQVLGDKGIICVEDLVHEIFTVGPNFKQVRGRV